MSAHKQGDPTTLNRLYGRSQGRPLRKSQRELLESLLPQPAAPVASVAIDSTAKAFCSRARQVGRGASSDACVIVVLLRL